MSQRIPAECTHERRPGTTVCLQCRHEARVAAAAQRRRALGRVALVVGGVAAVAGIVLLASGQLGRTPRADVTPEPVQLAVNDDLAKVTAPPLELPPLLPMVAPGRTELEDGVYVERTGDTVVVHFDTPALRTRRRDKFDLTVRTTLPQVYGARVDSLVEFPEGTIVGGRDLLGELTRVGVQLPLAGSEGELHIQPLTRPGQDGPLVVAYRAYLTR